MLDVTTLLPYLSIGISIVTIIILIVVYRKSGKCVMDSSCKEINPKSIRSCNTLLRHDFFFAIILSGVVCVFLLSLYFFESEKAINYFSFAATICSIILSVVAIFMSINGENKNSSMQTQFDLSVKNLEKISENITEQQKMMRKTIDEFHAAIEAQNESLNSTINEFHKALETQNEQVKQMLKSSEEMRATVERRFSSQTSDEWRTSESKK